MTLKEALDALDANENIKSYLSSELVEAFLALKRDEIMRYEKNVDDPDTREVTGWEQEEYLLRF